MGCSHDCSSCGSDCSVKNKESMIKPLNEKSSVKKVKKMFHVKHLYSIKNRKVL